MAPSQENDNAVSAGVQQDDLTIPLINFSTFLNGDSKTKQTTASAILHAFRTSGFLYLSNAGISPSTVQTVFSKSAKFFNRPEEQKEALTWETPESNRGYVRFGREKVTQSADPEEILRLRTSNPDYKETMEIGREGVEGLPNKWPDSFDEEGKEFTRVMREFHDTCKKLHMQVMRAIALGMGYEETFFDEYTDAGDNNLRLLHYPPVLKSVFENNPDAVRAGPHSDYGSITLLFQDDIGGLEVKSPQNTWVRAVPIKDTIVVNAGDLLARWSNDTIKSTNHRVVQPPAPSTSDESKDESDLYPTRYSVAYFCNPNFDKIIEALPGTYGDVSEKKYQPIKSGDYLTMRLAATY
ncbi:oxidoreductase, 2OG-Fe(II) oxygenase family [Talaromyces stipitatus ATCC 10500]|uniref:Oxidoreductase, 2OG-Fe(II) oxygenase family n=1 Tax=Talaromyces stipitatus (strain ATCC 10500 / CBS 375.48 / QM 6759 / NRRL 1006) TaxID=441959 RepID=B8MCB2_TALSN|nr:oxidoreductase, 2OG-Fe(II) oxygenase family [Talaromyces stipitatus ATCC 10500]EED18558.1 oxidoreductase, 2OG-Fe(II) oxygenase family [Talaromyces stipitatus ATCC 10500]